jgi:hypothetical protein
MHPQQQKPRRRSRHPRGPRRPKPTGLSPTSKELATELMAELREDNDDHYNVLSPTSQNVMNELFPEEIKMFEHIEPIVPAMLNAEPLSPASRQAVSELFVDELSHALPPSSSRSGSENPVYTQVITEAEMPIPPPITHKSTDGKKRIRSRKKSRSKKKNSRKRSKSRKR